MAERDMLGIYIPQRTSELSDAEILAEIEALRTRRETILAEAAAEKKAAVAKKPKKEKVIDLTKLDAEDILLILGLNRENND